MSQRCAAHCLSLTDINESFKIGEVAVDAAAQGLSGVMVTNNRKEGNEYRLEYSYSDIASIANMEKTVPENYMNVEKNNISQDGLNYLIPLVKGEVKLLHKDGVPMYLNIKDFI